MNFILYKRDGSQNTNLISENTLRDFTNKGGEI